MGVPLIELGLDSLMAVRIKNRVEYDFDLPPIQLTAVRDANLYNVEKLIEYAVEHRDEVQQLHEHQKTQTAEEIARAQAELLHGKVGKTEPVDSEAGVALPSPQNGEQPNPTGPALNVDVPPRDAASGSPSPPGRSSPASPRAASSTSCPGWTTRPRPRLRSGFPSAPKARSPPRTC